MPAPRDYPQGLRLTRPLVEIPGLLDREEGVLRSVDDEQGDQNFLRRARPTLETGVARGIVKKIDPTKNT